MDYSGIEFPVKQTQYGKIERQNNVNIYIGRAEVSYLHIGGEERRGFEFFVNN